MQIWLELLFRRDDLYKDQWFHETVTNCSKTSSKVLAYDVWTETVITLHVFMQNLTNPLEGRQTSFWGKVLKKTWPDACDLWPIRRHQTVEGCVKVTKVCSRSPLKNTQPRLHPENWLHFLYTVSILVFNCVGFHWSETASLPFSLPLSPPFSSYVLVQTQYKQWWSLCCC